MQSSSSLQQRVRRNGSVPPAALRDGSCPETCGHSAGLIFGQPAAAFGGRFPLRDWGSGLRPLWAWARVIIVAHLTRIGGASFHPAPILARDADLLEPIEIWLRRYGSLPHGEKISTRGAHTKPRRSFHHHQEASPEKLKSPDKTHLHETINGINCKSRPYSPAKTPHTKRVSSPHPLR